MLGHVLPKFLGLLASPFWARASLGAKGHAAPHPHPRRRRRGDQAFLGVSPPWPGRPPANPPPGGQPRELFVKLPLWLIDFPKNFVGYNIYIYIYVFLIWIIYTKNSDSITPDFITNQPKVLVIAYFGNHETKKAYPLCSNPWVEVCLF